MDIFQAIKRGDVAAVDRLLASGVPIETRSPYGKSLPMLAVDAGSPAVLELLIEQGADLRVTSEYGLTALIEALRWADEPCVDILLAAGLDLGEVHFRGGTALHAAVSGYRERAPGARIRLVERCLAAGIDPCDGPSLLQDAVRWDDPELMERLLRAGCPVDIKNDRGDTPLAEAVRDGRVSAVRCLLNAGAARRHPGVMKTLSTLRRKYKHVS